MSTIPATLVAMFQQSVAHYGNRPAARDKTRDANGKQNHDWRRWNYQALADDVQAFAQWLIAEGIEPGNKVAIFSQNRAEWTIADMAVLHVGAVSVPIYATNTPEQAKFILEHSEARVLCVDTQENYQKLREIEDEVTLLRCLTFDPISDIGDQTSHFWDVLEQGKALSHHADSIRTRSQAIEADDLATLVYTSGTTGQPKGVMLSHRNILHQFEGLANFNTTPADRSLCFLPLSHIYERAWSYAVMHFGIENVYLDNPREVVDFIREAKPTVMCAVPRFYEKVFNGFENQLEKGSALKRRIASWARSVGAAYYGAKFRQQQPPLGISAQQWLADKLVLRKVRAAIGGDKNFMTAGGAPLAKELEEFFLSIGVLVFQGYGLTETSPIITNNSPGRFKFGTVGHAIPEIEIKIDPKNGELLTRGPMVMKGYYKNAEETAKTMEGDWLRTGDVASIDEDGFVTITDRIKHILITAGGKNVAPQPIETKLTQSAYIESVMCVGDRKPFITALIVPDGDKLAEFASKQGLDGDIADWVDDEAVQALYQKLVDDACAGHGRVEQIRKFTLLTKPFSIEGGELTPKLSIKRKVILDKYHDAIAAMYVGH